MSASPHFPTLNVGAEVRCPFTRRWDTAIEFQPSYRAMILYDPDIFLDNNKKNDDARPFPLAPDLIAAPFLLCLVSMANDEKGATEAQIEKIEAIVGSESLGYEGTARGEHSGQKSPKEPKDLRDELADNRPEDLK